MTAEIRRATIVTDMGIAWSFTIVSSIAAFGVSTMSPCCCLWTYAAPGSSLLSPAWVDTTSTAKKVLLPLCDDADQGRTDET